MADQSINIDVGVKDNASSAMKTIGNNIGEAFNKVSLAAGVALAAVVGFAGKALTDFADAGEQISNLSAQTGISAEALSGMKVAADGMGLSVETVTGAVKKMQINLSAMGDDSKKANDALKPLGLTFEDIKGMRPEEQLFKMGNAIAQIKDPTERTAQAVKVFGKSGADLLPFFNEGKASLSDFVKHAKEMGLAFDEVSAGKAAALNDALGKLKASLAGVAQQVAVALAPSITQLVEAVTPWIVKISDWISKNQELTADIAKWVVGILAAIAVIAPLVAAVTFLLSPVGLLTLAIVAVIAAVVALIMQWQDLKNAAMGVWTAMLNWVTQKAKEIWNTIVQWFVDLKASWDAGWKSIFDALGGIWTSINSFITQKVDEVNTAIQSGLEIVKSTWMGIWQAIYDFLNNNIIGPIIKLIENLMGKINDLIGLASKIGGAVGGAVSGAASKVSGAVGGAWNYVTGGGKKAAVGGQFSAGTRVRVGEQGPEDIIMPADGMVIPNNQISSGGGIQVIITGNTLLDRNAATKIGDLIIQNLRLQRRLT